MIILRVRVSHAAHVFTVVLSGSLQSLEALLLVHNLTKFIPMRLIINFLVTSCCGMGNPQEIRWEQRARATNKQMNR